jgi:hypothetical protein
MLVRSHKAVALLIADGKNNYKLQFVLMRKLFEAPCKFEKLFLNPPKGLF